MDFLNYFLNRIFMKLSVCSFPLRYKQVWKAWAKRNGGMCPSTLRPSECEANFISSNGDKGATSPLAKHLLICQPAWLTLPIEICRELPHLAYNTPTFMSPCFVQLPSPVPPCRSVYISLSSHYLLIHLSSCVAGNSLGTGKWLTLVCIPST